jgi:hypothetical protein
MKLGATIDAGILVPCCYFETNVAIIVPIAAFVSAALASHISVTTAILVDIDSATAVNIATGTHHGCSSLHDDVIIDNILITAPPGLVDTDATASVIMASITSAGSTAPAYIARLSIDPFSSTGSGSATFLNKTVTATHDAAVHNAALSIHVVFGDAAVTTATSTSTSTAAIAAVDNAATSEFGIAADPFEVAVDIASCAPKYSK